MSTLGIVTRPSISLFSCILMKAQASNMNSVGVSDNINKLSGTHSDDEPLDNVNHCHQSASKTVVAPSATGSCYLSAMPVELVLSVTRYLPPRDRYAFAMTCRGFKNLILHEDLKTSKAWFAGLSVHHREHFKHIVGEINDHNLSGLLESFAKCAELKELFAKPTIFGFRPLLYYTISELMVHCTTFCVARHVVMYEGKKLGRIYLSSDGSNLFFFDTRFETCLVKPISRCLDKKEPEVSYIDIIDGHYQFCSPNGRSLFDICEEETVIHVQTQDGNWLRKTTIPHITIIHSSFSAFIPPVYEFSADSRHMLLTFYGELRILKSAPDGEWAEVAVFETGYSSSSGQFSGDGRRIISYSRIDCLGEIYGIDTDGCWVHEFTIFSEEELSPDKVDWATFSPDGGLVATITEERHLLRVHAVDQHRNWTRLNLDQISPVNSVVFGNNNRHMAALCEGCQTVKLFTLSPDGCWLLKKTIDHHRVMAMDFSADDRYLLTSCTDTIRVVDIHSDFMLQEWTPGRWDEFYRAGFSGDGQYLLISSQKALKIFARNRDGSWMDRDTFFFFSEYKQLDAAMFSDDGRHILVTQEETARVIGLGGDGKWRIKVVIDHGDKINVVRFSCVQCCLITVSLNGVVKIWYLRDGQSDRKLPSAVV